MYAKVLSARNDITINGGIITIKHTDTGTSCPSPNSDARLGAVINLDSRGTVDIK